MKKQTQVAIAGVLILMIFAIAVDLYNEKQAEKLSETAASLLIRDYSPTIGNKDAKVTIVEFFDPACETCKAFHPIVKKAMSDNPEKIKLVVRYLPLHKGSDYVVKLLEASRLQNKFWETLEAIYKFQPDWASHHNPQPKKLWSLLKDSELNLGKARKDMQSQRIERRLQQDMADAQSLKVTKTPGFFVNGKPLVRFGERQLINLIEAEIDNNY